MEEDSRNSYRIKDIKFFGSARRILLQSANGPCPLLAMCNVLLLENKVSISHDHRYISFGELVEMVSNYLFDVNGAVGDDSTSSRAANLRENLSSCLEILPKLNVGLDVNCKFGGPTDFEYTREMDVFDLLGIGLFHGWVVSNQDEKAYKMFGHLSYNQVVELLIAFEEAQQRIISADAPAEDGAAASKDDDASAGVAASSSTAVPTKEEDAKTIEQGMIIKEFLDRTASQLSYEGLLAVHEAVRERQLVVFFRNSHFSTMMKYKGELYVLCTDIAFAHSHVVWEKLDEVDGDTSYCDADFNVNTAGSDEAAALAAAEAAQEQMLIAAAGGAPNVEDADAMLALQLMQEDYEAQRAAQQAAPKAKAKAKAGAAPAAKAQAKAAAAPAANGQDGKKEKKKKSGKSCAVQ
mmetsp:Transcript_92229/g.238052  ORF Transcript_92229/g.238052 Transcript_92229/m.238052 type:complete len:408 (-) Transcript_92229:62-1285(-)